MLEYDREQIGRQAAEHGFIRDTFEKTCRLAELLVYFDRDIVLSKYLALKGGTAINMTIFRLPRLSVDIDLDFTENIPLDEMMDRRQLITDTIQLYTTSAGYELTMKSKYRHSLDSFVFAYTNAGGVRDNIKIEINYSQRSHILPLEKRPIETFGMFTPVEVKTVSPIEIFAGKINALLTRTAARDLYDVNNMILTGLFNKEQQDVLRKCTVFYSAVGGDDMPGELTPDKMKDITYHNIRTGLIPVIRKRERFDLVTAKDRVKQYLSNLLILTDNERDFLSSFRNGSYRPELLFEGEILARINDHPMVAWKMAQMRRNSSSNEMREECPHLQEMKNELAE